MGFEYMLFKRHIAINLSALKSYFLSEAVIWK
jgi:hypothetical protein